MKKNTLIIQYIKKRKQNSFLLKISKTSIILCNIPLLLNLNKICNYRFSNKLYNYFCFLDLLLDCGLIRNIFFKNEF